MTAIGQNRAAKRINNGIVYYRTKLFVVKAAINKCIMGLSVRENMSNMKRCQVRIKCYRCKHIIYSKRHTHIFLAPQFHS